MAQSRVLPVAIPMTSDSRPTADAVSFPAFLACPSCRGDLVFTAGGYSCRACNATGETRGRVFLSQPAATNHYFDEKHAVMQEGNDSDAVQQLCYAEQSRIAESLIAPGDVVIDIGCGPDLHYRRPEGAVVVGLDPSLESLMVNKALDLAIYGSATAMPLKDQSVDRLFMFYAIHHMIGTTVEQNRGNLEAVLRECRRVVRPGGSIVIFDMSPWLPAWIAQNLMWNWAKCKLGGKLDMYFWRHSALDRLSAGLQPFARFESRVFRTSPWLVFPPVFSLPSLRVPRILYPFGVRMYRWSF